MSKKKRLLNKVETSATLTKSEEKKDASPKVHQDNKLNWDLNIKVSHRLNPKQEIIHEVMKDKKTRAVFIDGIYGTSKTWLSILSSLELLNEKKIDEIIYLRNPVESSSTGKIGFLKGESSEKMAPYAAILYQKLDEFLPKQEIDKLIKENRITVMPVGFTRGHNWNCKAIIVDEASSMSYDDLFLLMTRCGPFTKIFIIGDTLNQNDIGNKAGMKRMFNFFEDDESKKNGIYTFELKEASDVVRSGFVRFIMIKTGLIKDSKEYKADRDIPMFENKVSK
jgi:phosphate starvation-inducible protein PhoH